MKKLTTLALGLGLALGSVAFAQDSTGTMAPGDSTTKSTTKKPKKAKKSKKPATTDSTSTSSDKKM